MKKVLLIVIIIIIAIVAIVFYGKGYKSVTPSNTTPQPTSQAAEPNSINIQNFSFNPGTLTIKTGTTVTWTNNDSTTHSVKSSSFNSSDLNTGDTFKFTFDKAGSFNYNCGIHPTMTGTIIVQ